MNIYLPRRGDIPITGEEDPLIYYYFPIINYFYRMRLWLALNFIRNRRFNKLLEIGYGSGILFPELAKYARHLYGVDIHQNNAKVANALKKFSINVELKTGSILSLPYEDQKFNGVICISVLEHIKDLKSAIGEITRIATNGASLIFGFPVANKLTSLFYTLVGFDYKTHHPSDHQTILRELANQTKIVRLIIYPEILPIDYALYCCCHCIKLS